MELTKTNFSFPANSIANAVTVSRIVLTGLFALSLIYGTGYPSLYTLSIVLFFLVMVSDYADGAIVRTWGKPTVLGSFLDPLADKICIHLSFVVITVIYGFPLWATVILVCRDIVVLGAWYYFIFVLKRSFTAVPHLFGKVMVCAQMVTILCVIFQLQYPIIMTAWVVSILFSLFSLIIYAFDLTAYRKSV